MNYFENTYNKDMKNICFITKNDYFDALISQLRRSNINAKKQSLSANLEDYELIVLDLSYPKELAYTFLSKINRDENLSDKVILAAITTKTQFHRLRSIALGCDGYISPGIEIKDFLEKARSLFSKELFLKSKSFSNTKLTVKFEGVISHLSETGCLLKSKASLSPSIPLNIDSTIFKDLELHRNIKFSLARINPATKRSFISEVIFQNLEESQMTKIRRLVDKWSVK